MGGSVVSTSGRLTRIEDKDKNYSIRLLVKEKAYEQETKSAKYGVKCYVETILIDCQFIFTNDPLVDKEVSELFCNPLHVWFPPWSVGVIRE